MRPDNFLLASVDLQFLTHTIIETLRAGHLGRHLETGQTRQTRQTGQTGQTGLIFKLDFPGHL